MIAFDVSSLETQRQTIQVAIDARKSAKERNRLGQFATPNALAVGIAQYVQSVLGSTQGNIRFADPSLGSGSFYSAALAVFGAEKIHSAVGVELDAEFVAAARRLWSASGLEVVPGDFSEVLANDACPAAPNVILANPPYVRHHHICRDDKERLQALALKMTGARVSGLAGLYVYFLLLATAWLQEGGIAAWLIPSEFMDVNYGTVLKDFLGRRVTLIRVHRFSPSDAQFGDALVSSVVLVFRKLPPKPDHSVEFTFGGTLAKPDAADSIGLELLRATRKWTMFPDTVTNDRHALNDGNSPALGDFFRVQRGIATGCNAFFVLKRAQAISLGLPSQFLRPILPSPRHLKTTCIDAGSDGYPLLDSPLCVIDCNLPENLIETQYPALWSYLKTAQSRGVMEGYLIGKRSPWYRQEQREPSAFLCTYMGRGSGDKAPFRFIWNRSRAIGSNLYLMLYPQNGLADMLCQHPNRAQLVHTLLSEVTGDELRGEGRIYGGGLNKIEPSELARISAASFVRLWPEIGARAPMQQAELFG